MSETVTADDLQDASPKEKLVSSKFWLAEIEAAKNREEPWRLQAKAVIDRYEDDRDNDSSENKMNIYWSNVEVTKAALFAGGAKPDVRRRFDNADKVSRNISLILERTIAYLGEENNFDDDISEVVFDFTTVGRGVSWVVYDPQISGEDIIGQSVRLDCVYYNDFLLGESRNWKQVPWIARRHSMTRKQLEEFVPDQAAKIPMDNNVLGFGENDDEELKTHIKRAEVWEIWDRATKTRLYVVKGYKEVIKTDSDPYGLKDFFPMPAPIYSVKVSGKMLPRPDFTQYQDQANELDDINNRISKLIEELRVCGVYDSSQEEALKGIDKLSDNEFLPVELLKDFSSGKTGDFPIIYKPLGDILTVLQGLYEQRATIIQTIYEVTGISDIVRGSTDPRETKGAQQIKAQFGNMRFNNKRTSVDNMICGIYRIVGEIVSEHFEPKILTEISQVKLLQNEAEKQQLAQQDPSDPRLNDPTWEEIMHVLRDDNLRGFKVAIESDATAFDDAMEEKQSRMEFATVMQQLLEKAMPAMQQQPEIAPLIEEIISFVIGSFKVGRQMEEVFSDAFEQFKKAQEEAKKQPPKPDPGMIRAEQETKLEQQEAQRKQAETQDGIQTNARVQDREDFKVKMEAKNAENIHF
ncbi:MAG: hypothetical protein OCD03_13215 [Hyphomicrobiales bacterium]